MNENSAIGLAAQPAVAVFAAVKIVRRERYEALVCQTRREIVVCGNVALDNILRQASATVLAYHHRAPLTRPEVLRKKQDAPRENLRPYIQDDFEPCPFRIVVDPPSSRIGWQERLIELAQNFFVKVSAIPLRPLDELTRRERFMPELGGPGFVG